VKTSFKLANPWAEAVVLRLKDRKEIARVKGKDVTIECDLVPDDKHENDLLIFPAGVELEKIPKEEFAFKHPLRKKK